MASAHAAASAAAPTKHAAAEQRLRDRQAAGTRIPLYETQQQKVRRENRSTKASVLTVCVSQVAADLVSKLPYILPPLGVLILTLLGFAVFM
jgi:hypothetical protein